jgi:hypothetical protein
MQKSVCHVEFINDYEYFMVPDGRLFRPRSSEPIRGDNRRQGEFVTFGRGIELALELERLEAERNDHSRAVVGTCTIASDVRTGHFVMEFRVTSSTFA